LSSVKTAEPIEMMGWWVLH